MQTPEHSNTYPFIPQPVTRHGGVQWLVRHNGTGTEWGAYPDAAHAQRAAVALRERCGNGADGKGPS